MKTKAQVLPKEIAVTHSIRPDVQREFLSFSIAGWEEVAPLTKKVLLYEGKKFTFSGWNSERNECYFFKPLNEEVQTATWI